jgi:hypothetical protein
MHNLQGIFEDIRRGIPPATFANITSKRDEMVAALLKDCWSQIPSQRLDVWKFSERVYEEFPTSPTEPSHANTHSFWVPASGPEPEREDGPLLREGEVDPTTNRHAGSMKEQESIKEGHDHPRIPLKSLQRKGKDGGSQSSPVGLPNPITNGNRQMPRRPKSPLHILPSASRRYENGENSATPLSRKDRILRALEDTLVADSRPANSRLYNPTTPLSPSDIVPSVSTLLEASSSTPYIRERTGSTTSNTIRPTRAPPTRLLSTTPSPVQSHTTGESTAVPPGLRHPVPQRLIPIIERTSSPSPSRQPPTPLRTPPPRVNTSSPRRFSLSLPLPLTLHRKRTGSFSKLSVKAIIDGKGLGSGDEIDMNDVSLTPSKTPDLPSGHPQGSGDGNAKGKRKRSRLALWGSRKKHVHPNDDDTDDEKRQIRKEKRESLEEPSTEARMNRTRQWIESICGVH